MEIPASKLKIQSKEPIQVIDLHIPKEGADDLLQEKGSILDGIWIKNVDLACIRWNPNRWNDSKIDRRKLSSHAVLKENHDIRHGFLVDRIK